MPNVNTDDLRIIAVGPHCWGRGETLQEAYDRAKENWPRGRYPKMPSPFRMSYYVTSDPFAYIDEMGSLVHQADAFVKQIHVTTLADKKERK